MFINLNIFIMPEEYFYARPPYIEEIRASIAKTNEQKRKAGLLYAKPWQGLNAGILRIKTGTEWMMQEREKAPPRKLFGDFWYEGELCILFADTNVGKSILAAQIANNIAQGESMQPFTNELEPETAVLYIDFELGAKQFESRYDDHQWGSFAWGHTFFRAEFNPEADDSLNYDSFEQHLTEAITLAVMTTKAKVLIIDNLTYMRSGTERAKDALPLMKYLKSLKSKYKVSILALAHTPKRNVNKPLTVNDLQGSKMLINFCDSAFAIGESAAVSGGRYLKQIKQRYTQMLYGEDNVCVCYIRKELSFLQFKFDSYAHERAHLRKPEIVDPEERKQKALELRSLGLSYRQIAEEMGISSATVSRLF